MTDHDRPKSFSNRYGTVSDQAITFYRGQTLVMAQVVSAQLLIRRHVLWGLALSVTGLIFFDQGVPGVILGILLLLGAALLFMGSPRVYITAADGRTHESNGKPWDRAEASRFVGAVNRELNRPSPAEDPEGD